MSLVENEYRRLVAAMTPAERMERSANMLAWARAVTARQIIAEHGPMAPEKFKWEVALRHYGHEPIMRRLIEQVLSDDPG